MRYRSIVADSARWEQFDLRPGDIVISTPPKSGTTWMQLLCALVVFDGPDFPAPLNTLSPWLDMLDRSIDDVRAGLDAQLHRRVIKTHTPLDGITLRDDVTYVVVGRDPRDVCVSWEHHLANVQFERFIALRAAAVGLDDLAELGMADGQRPEPPTDAGDRFRAFVEDDTPGAVMSLAAVLHHLDTAWQRRSSPNIVMVHYADLLADRVGELRRLATALGVDLAAGRAEALAAEASIEQMRAHADDLAPTAHQSLLVSNTGFFRSAASGEWRSFVDEGLHAAYDARVRSLIEPDLAAWVHAGRLASGVDPSRS